MASLPLRWCVLLAFALSAQVSCCWQSGWFTGWGEVHAHETSRCCGSCEQSGADPADEPAPCPDCGKAGLKRGLLPETGEASIAGAAAALLPVATAIADLLNAPSAVPVSVSELRGDIGPPRTLLGLRCALVV